MRTFLVVAVMILALAALAAWRVSVVLGSKADAAAAALVQPSDRYRNTHLFTQDGCSVYRFTDPDYVGDRHYWIKCVGYGPAGVP